MSRISSIPLPEGQRTTRLRTTLFTFWSKKINSPRGEGAIYVEVEREVSGTMCVPNKYHPGG